MSFGPALSLGVASLDEYVDIKLIDPPESAALVERLNAASAGGVRFVDARVLEPHEPAIGATITGARYVLALAEGAVALLGGRAELERRIAAFLSAKEARVLRRIKGIGKPVDVRRVVGELALGGREASELLSRAGVVGRSVPLELTLSISQAGSAKISELCEVLLGDASFPHVALRTRLLRSELAQKHAFDAVVGALVQDQPSPVAGG
jgi:radical SAM-linked protein